MAGRRQVSNELHRGNRVWPAKQDLGEDSAQSILLDTPPRPSILSTTPTCVIVPGACAARSEPTRDQSGRPRHPKSTDP
jgi:hypothetical protein